MHLVEGPKGRRRGAELENALLDAAWAELTESGYDAFTIDRVAARAGTSRPVVYRRWPTKGDLVGAAIAHVAARDRPPVPDTGSLRGDLIAMLRSSNETRVHLAALISTHLAAYYRDTGTNLQDLRELMIGGRTPTIDVIIERAVARGEIDPARLTPRIARLPIDLFRLHVLMTFTPMPDEEIEELIDTIFLPLVRPS